MKEKIIELLKSTERKGIDKLLDWMEQARYFNAPCSGAHHLAKDGGLAEHSLNVYKVMKGLYSEVLGGNCKIPKDSLIISALLHDLGKTGDFGKPNYIENWVKDGKTTKSEPEQKYKRSESKPYMANPELLYVPHEIRSISIASKFIELTEEEYFAILYHNGLYGDLKYAVSGKETPLYLLLHMADMWSSRVIEVGREKEPE